IITVPKNSLLKQYTKLFEMENIQLTIENEVLDFMVEKALEYKLGARGLRSIFESILTDAMFDLPGSETKTFVVNLAYAQSMFNKSKLSLLKVA
ncbi:MAG: ATP-dependent Clp protease ATP-binding subunit ClpX, partial [Chitinophagaceae bacterium]